MTVVVCVKSRVVVNDSRSRTRLVVNDNSGFCRYNGGGERQ